MPPKIVLDAVAIVDQGSQVPCSATGTPPIYIALIRNFTVAMNTTNTASSKLYKEGNYTCVATSKYGTDTKHFVIKGGEKIRYFETNPMQRVCKEGVGVGLGEPIMPHAEFFYQITHHEGVFYQSRFT